MTTESGGLPSELGVLSGPRNGYTDLNWWHLFATNMGFLRAPLQHIDHKQVDCLVLGGI